MGNAAVVSSLILVFCRVGSIEEQEFFGEVLISIKQVIQSHLHDVQLRFLDRFQSLQTEIKSRDSMISRLQMRINELEGLTIGEEVKAGSSGSSGDIAFCVSVFTILCCNFQYFQL